MPKTPDPPCARLPDLDQREQNRQIEIASADEWYAAGQKLQAHDIVAGLLQRDALGLGFTA